MLSSSIKLNIVNTIINTPTFLGRYEEYDGILTFLMKIWDLKEMPSTDARYKNAYEDTNQHIVNNDDWTFEYLFLERLNLVGGDEKYFILFIEAIVNPTVRKSRQEIIEYVQLVNKLIQTSNFKLILTDYFEELPVYRYRNSSELSDLPIDIIQNKIPIYLKDNQERMEYPSVIIENDNWNDYSLETRFNITFQKDISTSYNLGKVKIMKRESKFTVTTLSSKFYFLSNDYCSLGQEKSYYINLRHYLGKDYYSFLLALRDVAIFPKIHDEFENDDIFKTSLIRGNSVERLARTVRFEIEGISPNEYYKFNYSHTPPYAKNSIALNFDFEYNNDFEQRIYALIGKNGTGKTRILSSLAKNLAEKESPNFTPRKPIYGKVFTVSYSFFDQFEIPSSDASFNYVYCGLKKIDKSLKTETELFEGFVKAANKIKERRLEHFWIGILKNFLTKEVIDHISYKTVFNENNDPVYFFNIEEFEKVKKQLSSGQSIIVYMISEILSQIRYDSLILFDEPETHLHPNAISALLNTLFELVRQFESFCVIATHSPLIIQEIPARNIFVIEREDDLSFVRGLERESFGENLTVINQDIFGNRDVPKHFVSSIEDLIKKGKSYEQIISILESDKLPISSNIRLYIKALITPAE